MMVIVMVFFLVLIILLMSLFCKLKLWGVYYDNFMYIKFVLNVFNLLNL